MSFLDVNNLSVSYSSQPVLDRVSFNVEKGEIISVVGPNGSGKSTLVKALLGLIPSTGEVSLSGQKMIRSSALAGYVPQRFEFDKTFPLTVHEFLSLTHRNLADSEKKELIEDLQVDGLFRKKLGSLSGGQLQRVLIVQALLARPQILILDEPTTGIDVKGTQDFYKLIQHLNQEHQVTIMLVSHETDVAYSLSDKVLCLDNLAYHLEYPKRGTRDDLFKKTHHDDKLKPLDHLD
ncbi:MAG: hypothetical protein A3I29_00590 [Candidatus Magasanikbacteria bacterium RIFCSPLOWO2_02_FULL_44_11]|uniref:ABC transporter domain-containing protein n=2 Tax=Candidatus Magasanikiibacteriota TaxID=1752731 RepID=A0A1F6N9M5_9BACT|nr:MAG: hypothetical protein A3D53_03825 [Candidatus Magasanikbacteria bacterium RIFCSPHIGHO2_02_FULL_45_10]OGH80433.1 MAG: hypothetical protein A3I29_00590 [Candidatus Magasanikbacteria bacterium RIFCSPLOWO2_02_FULL_44_11]